jgi:hypothetical protein
LAKAILKPWLLLLIVCSSSLGYGKDLPVIYISYDKEFLVVTKSSKDKVVDKTICFKDASSKTLCAPIITESEEYAAVVVKQPYIRGLKVNSLVSLAEQGTIPGERTAIPTLPSQGQLAAIDQVFRGFLEVKDPIVRSPKVVVKQQAANSEKKDQETPKTAKPKPPVAKPETKKKRPRRRPKEEKVAEVPEPIEAPVPEPTQKSEEPKVDKSKRKVATEEKPTESEERKGLPLVFRLISFLHLSPIMNNNNVALESDNSWSAKGSENLPSSSLGLGIQRGVGRTWILGLGFHVDNFTKNVVQADYVESWEYTASRIERKGLGLWVDMSYDITFFSKLKLLPGVGVHYYDHLIDERTVLHDVASDSQYLLAEGQSAFRSLGLKASFESMVSYNALGFGLGFSYIFPLWTINDKTTLSANLPGNTETTPSSDEFKAKLSHKPAGGLLTHFFISWQL